MNVTLTPCSRVLLQKMKVAQFDKKSPTCYKLKDCYGVHQSPPLEFIMSPVGIASGYVLNYRGSRVRFPAGAGNFSHVQNGSGAYPASNPMGSRGSFPGGKAAGA
jgi:hypothetical protein